MDFFLMSFWILTERFCAKLFLISFKSCIFLKFSLIYLNSINHSKGFPFVSARPSKLMNNLLPPPPEGSFGMHDSEI